MKNQINLLLAIEFHGIMSIEYFEKIERDKNGDKT